MFHKISHVMRNTVRAYRKWSLLVGLFFYNTLVYAVEAVGVDGIDDMVKTGQNMIWVAAKWGGIATVVGGAIALGSGKLEGALAQTVCKILIVSGLLIAAFTFFKDKFAFGFAF